VLSVILAGFGIAILRTLLILSVFRIIPIEFSQRYDFLQTKTADDTRSTLLKICVSAFHGLAVLAEGIITTTFCSVFRESKAVSISIGTIDVVKRLFLYSITRGALLCVLQIGHLVMYLNQPQENFFVMALHLILYQLYAMTTCELNERPRLRDHMEDDIGPLVFAQESATPNTSHQESETEQST
ncbi:hypothetical protein BDQ12DRAFT_672302, partial [Crucibulum laeve]